MQGRGIRAELRVEKFPGKAGVADLRSLTSWPIVSWGRARASWGRGEAGEAGEGPARGRGYLGSGVVEGLCAGFLSGLRPAGRGATKVECGRQESRGRA